MKQGIVKFSKEFVTETGLKEWMGLEWDVDTPFDEAKAMDVFTKVKNFVCNYKGNSQGVIDSQNNFVPPGPPPIIQKKPEDREVGLTPELLTGCQDLVTLQTFFMLVQKSDSQLLMDTYKKRKSELVAKETKEILEATNALSGSTGDVLLNERIKRNKK